MYWIYYTGSSVGARHILLKREKVSGWGLGMLKSVTDGETVDKI